jgi:hypothetical protein
VTEIQHIVFSDWGGVVEAMLLPKGEEARVVRVRISTKRVKNPLRKCLKWLAANHPHASYSYHVETGACAPVEYE